MKKSYKLLLVLGAALLLILSFPGFNMWIFAWVAFLPLFFAIEGQEPLKAFLISYLAGFIFFLGTIYWLIHVTFPGMFVVVAYLALYFGIFGLLINYSQPLAPYFQLLSIPAAWVALEWIRAHMFTGFGWNLLGYSQSLNLPIIQIADMFGVYGVSFIIIMFNVAVFLAVKNFRKRAEEIMPLAMAVMIILIVSGYGFFRLNNVFTGERLKVAVIQGNIPQEDKWDQRFADMIMDKYDRLTKEVSQGKADLVIWPETSVPGFIESETDLFENVRDLSVGIRTPILIGAPRYEDINGRTSYYNSAYFFLKDGKMACRYDKVHLVPFGEYLPLKNILGFVERFSRRPIGDFTAGKEFTVFEFFISRTIKEKDLSMRFAKKIGFSCLICFEDIFPDLAREFIKRDALFLVNITNDAWFGRSSAAYQHAQASVFRAVENRTNVIRAANTGLSCFIDQKGRIAERVSLNGKDLFVDGSMIHEIILSRIKTIYTVYGDMFAYICIFFTAWSAIRSLRKRGVGDFV